MSCCEKRTRFLPASTVAAATPKKKCSRCTSRQIACFSSLAWGFSSTCVSYPGELGCTFCAVGTPLSPLTQAHFAFLYWLHPVSFITSTPPKLGGAPRSGVYTGSKSRKKDQRDPRERFPSLVLFIRLLLLPLKAPPCSTVAHCVSQGTPFSPVPVTELFIEKRGECAEGEYECVETACK